MAPEVGGGQERGRYAVAREDRRKRRGLLREAGEEQALLRGEDGRHAHRGGEARHERRVSAGRDRRVLLDRLLRERQHARGERAERLDGDLVLAHRLVERDVSVEADAEKLEVESAGRGDRGIVCLGRGGLREVRAQSPIPNPQSPIPILLNNYLR